MNKYWMAIGIAVICNAIANIMLKKLSLQGVPTTPWHMVFDGKLWLLFVSAGGLVLSYAYAIRGFSLPVGYVLITSGALVLLAILNPLVFGDTLKLINLIGISLVVLGIALVVQ